jgi:hypothetical protein
MYYYNRSTGKTSWQRPAAPGAAPGSVAKAPVAASAAAAVAVSEPPGASPVPSMTLAAVCATVGVSEADILEYSAR